MIFSTNQNKVIESMVGSSHLRTAKLQVVTKCMRGHSNHNLDNGIKRVKKSNNEEVARRDNQSRNIKSK